LHKLGIEAHAYAHYTSLLCFALLAGDRVGGGGVHGVDIHWLLRTCRHGNGKQLPCNF